MAQLISIIVPGYNVEVLLTPCLTSLAEQTYKNLEVIFVNDSSTDGTLSVATDFLRQSGVRYKIIDMDKRSGVSAARNAGINASNGEYLSFLDADDFLLPDSIETLYKAASGDSGDAEVTLSGYIALDEASGKEKSFPIDKSITSALLPDIITAKRILNKIPDGPSILYKKNFISAKGIVFTENCTNGEDGEFMLKAMAVCKKNAICHDARYVYRLHNGMGSRASSAMSLLRRYSDNTEAQARVGEFIMENCRSPILRRLACSLIMPSVVMRRMSYYAMKKDRKAFDIAFSEIDRDLLSESRKCFFEKPEVFLRTRFLLMSPDKYYKKYAARLK